MFACCHVLFDSDNVQLFSVYGIIIIKWWNSIKVQVYLRSHFLFFSVQYDYVKHTVTFWLHPDYCYILQSIFFFHKSTVISLSYTTKSFAT